MLSFLRHWLSLSTQRDREEAWLSASASADELERRLRQLEGRSPGERARTPQGQWFERGV